MHEALPSGTLGPMLDIADRSAFEVWFDANKDDILDQISQRPRSLKRWAADFAVAMKASTAEMGEDPGFAGVFEDSEEGMGLHDPEGDDEEKW